jgi:hypothetical protein
MAFPAFRVETVNQDNKVLEEYMNKSYNKFITVFSRVRSWAMKYRQKSNPDIPSTHGESLVSVSDRQEEETFWLKQIQSTAFAEEIEASKLESPYHRN